MRAYRLTDWQQPAFREIPDPEPGPGQVLVKVAGVGLCHSDVLFLEAAAGLLPYEVPFTLGHEISGHVAALGEGVDGPAVGTAVAVACMSPCWQCRWCLRGLDNYCVESWRGRGFGRDGGLADYVLAGAREIVPLGDLDPVLAAPLTDAGATSFHAVRRVQPKLHDDSTAVVMGVGGLGGYAVQWLRQLTDARIVAVEARPERAEAARRLGAAEVIDAGEKLSKRLSEAVGADGADAVLDFVGADTTMRAALRVAAPAASVAVVGQGFGSVDYRWGATAHDVDLFVPQGAPIAELHEVIARSQNGRVQIDAELFDFDHTPEAYERLKAGTLNGRAVVRLPTSPSCQTVTSL